MFCLFSLCRPTKRRGSRWPFYEPRVEMGKKKQDMLRGRLAGRTDNSGAYVAEC